MSSFKSLKVNGQPITIDEIQRAAGHRRQEVERNGSVLTPEERLSIRDEAIDSLIGRTLLLQEARRLELMPSREEILKAAGNLSLRANGVAGCRAEELSGQMLQEVEEDLLARNLAELWSGAVPRPKPSEVREFYRKNRDQFRTGELAWASHIVKHTEGAESGEKRAEVEHLRSRVEQGEPWVEVAARYSDCPENGGDLGYFPRGAMVEEFDEVIFSVPLNTVTPVFQTRFGYHIAVVHDRKPEGIRALDEIQPEVERLVSVQKQDREIGRRLAALRKKALIEET